MPRTRINSNPKLRYWLAHWKCNNSCQSMKQRSEWLQQEMGEKVTKLRWRSMRLWLGVNIRILNPSTSFIIQQQILSTSSASAVLLWRPTKQASFLWIQRESAAAALFHFVWFICSSPLSALLVLFLFPRVRVRWNPNLLLFTGKAHGQNQNWLFFIRTPMWAVGPV